MENKEIIYTVFMCLIILLIYYCGTYKNKKNQKKLKEMQNNLKIGDKVITFSGLKGKIVKIEQDYVIVELYPSDTKISIEKWAIAGIDDRS